MADFKTDESAFNFAVEYLKRISLSLSMCEQFATLNNADGWISWLRVVFRQLSCKLNDKEVEEFNNYFKKINILLNDKSKRHTERNKILYLLDDLETKLRQRLQKKGMLLPSKEDPRFAVLQR